MKRLADYELTDEEIREIFASLDNYKLHLKLFEDDPVCGDVEKYDIAALLHTRGEKEESRRLIASIEDEEYRITCLQLSAGWDAPEGMSIPCGRS